MKQTVSSLLVAAALLAAPALLPAPAVAADAGKTAKAAKTAPAAAGHDQLAVLAEEKDRLAREKKEMTEREAMLKKQLETSQTLVAEKDALLKQLQDEIKALKSAK